MVRSGWVALAFVAISQTHSDAFQGADSAHDVCSLDLFGGQILLDATNDIGTRFDVQDVNFGGWLKEMGGGERGHVLGPVVDGCGGFDLGCDAEFGEALLGK